MVLKNDTWSHQKNCLSLLDTVTGKEQRRFEGHTRDVNAATFSPNGKYILTGEWGEVRYSSIKSFPKLSDVGIYPALTRIRSTAEKITESQLIQQLLVATNLLIEKVKYKEAYKLLRQAQTVSGYEHDKEVLAQINYCSIKGNAIRKGLNTAWRVATFTGHLANILSISFSPDGKYILSGSGDYYDESGIENSNIRLWEIESGKNIRCYEGAKGYVSSVVFSPDGKLAFAGSGEIFGDITEANASKNNIIIWDLVTGNGLKRFEVFGEGFCNIVFSPDTNYVFSWGNWGNEGTIRLWDTNSGTEVKQFNELEDDELRRR